MSAPVIHVGDVNTVFRPRFVDETGAVINVSSATTKLIYFRAPGGTVYSVTAAFDTDGSDGKVKYATVAGSSDSAPGTLNKAGEWSVWAWVRLSGGSDFTAGPYDFDVAFSPRFPDY